MRERWDDFQQAYEDMLSECSTPHAPWHLVPANRKWFRDYAVARTVRECLESLDLKWPKPDQDLKSVRIV